MTWKDNATLIHDAVVNHDCATYADISALTGLTPAVTGISLWWLRRPENAKQLGWTIPHVPRGAPRNRSARRYMVVGLQGQVLDVDDQTLVTAGARSTLKYVASTAEGLAHILRVAAKATPSTRIRRVFGRVARQLENVAAEARDSVELELDSNVP